MRLWRRRAYRHAGLERLECAAGNKQRQAAPGEPIDGEANGNFGHPMTS